MHYHRWQVEALREFFEKKHLLLEVATGTGKTFFAVQCIKRLLEERPHYRCLVVVPKNVILEDTWQRAFYEHGFCIDDIGMYYGQAKVYSRITITTMASLTRMNYKMFEVAVFDEIHNMFSPRLQRVLDHPYEYKMGLTATLRTEQGIKEWEIRKHFGYNTFKYDIQKALEDDIVAHYDFCDVTVELLDEDVRLEYERLEQEINKLVHSVGGVYAMHRLRKEDPRRAPLMAAIGKRNKLVHSYERKLLSAVNLAVQHEKDKVVLFSEYNDASERMKWMLIERGVRCRLFNSTIKPEDNSRTIEGFSKGEFNVLIATRALDEGYNLPAIDVVIIMSGNSTKRQTVQRVGRALRKKAGKRTTIYQLFVKGTMDERNAHKRAEALREHADNVTAMVV